MTRLQAFKHFLKYFSLEELPIVLSDDSLVYFSSQNKPLDADSIRRFLMTNKDQDDEDMTEYIACTLIPDTKDFVAVVYWKGGLLSYEFILATYSSNGVLIDRKVIAGLKSDGDHVRRSVATIEEDLSIQIVVGELSANETLYDPQKSQSMSMDILTDGSIIFAIDEA